MKCIVHARAYVCMYLLRESRAWGGLKSASCRLPRRQDVPTGIINPKLHSEDNRYIYCTD